MKIRILFVVPFLSSGGAERVVSIWASELAKLESDVHVLVHYRVEEEYSLYDTVKIHALTGGKSAYSELCAIQKLQRLRKKIIEINPDVILPFITHVGIMTTIANLGLKSCIVETIRTNPRCSPRNRLLRWLRNFSVVMASRCIVQNQEQKNYFPNWLWRHIEIFPNPISDEFIQDGKVFFSNEIRRIVAVGRLEEQKNYPLLIEAVSKVVSNDSNIELRIYGEGSQEENLRQLISTRGVSDRVFLCGRTSRVREVLMESDLYVLCSNFEGMPNSLMEAMATGLPCISTDCPTGPSELIENGVNGYLIPVNDEKRLVQVINHILKYPTNAIEMGRRARTAILCNHGVAASARRLLKFLRTI